MMRRFVLAGFAAIALAACADVADDAEGSEDAITQAKPSQHIENTPFNWATQPYEEFLASRVEIGRTAEPIVADDDPLTVRLQTWLDRIDAIVRTDIERKSGRPFAAPKPIAKVVQSQTTYNAWADGLAVCLDAPLGAGTGPRAFLDSTSVSSFPISQCVKPDWNKESFASYWNADKPACALSFAGGAAKVSGSACVVDPGATAASDLVSWTTAPYIHFTSWYLSSLSEDKVALTAAHELGHYYLAHTTSVGLRKYGFWFNRGMDGEPRPAPNATQLAAAYAEVVTSPTTGAPLGKRYSPRLRDLLLKTVFPLLLERAEPDFVCAKARAELLQSYPLFEGSGPFSGDARTQYERFESLLATCAARLPLSGDGPGSISAGRLLFSAKDHRPGPKTKLTLRLDDTLGSFIDRVDAQAKVLDGKAARLIAQARGNHIGLYTTEQAADDFALEIGVRLGFTTDEILASEIDQMRAIDQLYSWMTPEQLAEDYRKRGEITGDACQALLDAKFTRIGSKGEQEPVMVDMGQLDEPHHASCYRVYNLFVQARTHRYKVGPRSAPLEPAWDVLRTHAYELTVAAPLPPPPPAPPAP